MKNIAKISFVLALGAPFAVLAQSVNTTGFDLLATAINLLKLVPQILIAIIIVFIIWKGVTYALAKEEDDRTEARSGMIGGLIALAIAFSIFGIVRILQGTIFGSSVNPNNPPPGQITVPQIL